MTFDPALLDIAADWCVNLSAGWFGAAFIVSSTAQQPQYVNERIFIEDIVLSLAFFAASYILKAI